MGRELGEGAYRRKKSKPKQVDCFSLNKATLACFFFSLFFSFLLFSLLLLLFPVVMMMMVMVTVT